MSEKSLLERRQYTMANGGHYFYETPLHLVKGEGIWLWDSAGRKYLDCYNNVASVGHCHPKVVEALYAQAKQLNTHTRYLHENIVEAGEALAAKLPGDLDAVAFVCTGTEANDLAIQIARILTGKEGVIVTEASYHGNSALVTQLSTDMVPAEDRAHYVGTIKPPNTYRGPFREGEHQDLAAHYAVMAVDAMAGLDERGMGTAALMIDSSFDSNGILIPPDGYFANLTGKVRDAGGIVIMDEVQAGYCRMGTNWWGFEAYGVEPDIVTVGKPMGDGHPVAALVMRRSLLEKLQSDQALRYFNTFGGNPVSTAVAKAVIDVIDEEGLLANATEVGGYLGAGLAELGQRHRIIGNIQGSGLFWGMDLVRDRETREPLSRDDLRRITSELVEEGVLMGSTGRYGNILKLRPPLIFTRDNADRALTAIDKVLGRHKDDSMSAGNGSGTRRGRRKPTQSSP